MIVKVLRRIVTNFQDKVATAAMKQIRARKAGYPYTGPNKDLAIISILVDALMEANEPLLESSTVRLPEWMSQNDFNSLITKITLT